MHWLALLWFGTAPSMAAEEVVVFGDGYERWDDTRWHVKTDMRLPLMMRLGTSKGNFLTNGLQIDSVVHCDIDHQNRNRAEVFCLIEDISVRATMTSEQQKRSETSSRPVAYISEILDQIDAKLTHAKLQLRVSPDGQVKGIDIEGMPPADRRESWMNETITPLVQRLMVGFDMKLRKEHQLMEGSWKEYNSAMMTIPIPVSMKTTLGSSELAHVLSRYKGTVLVQSVGKMQMSIPKAGVVPFSEAVYVDENNRGHLTKRQQILQTLTGDFTGVAVFDPNSGYMLERVWTMSADAVSNGLLRDAQQYHFQGNIVMLDPDEKPVLGKTGVIAHPHLPVPDHLDAWVALQER